MMLWALIGLITAYVKSQKKLKNLSKTTEKGINACVFIFRIY